VFFRCHNREFFFAPKHIKVALINLWAKYKDRYGVKIIDFCIMSNHAHLILKAEDTEFLGDFMRTVNSQIARIINKHFDRDSQAIRERYKSPLIASDRYLDTAIRYVWLNRKKVDPNSDPRTDPFCSLSWRLNREVIKSLASDAKNFALIEKLLDDVDGAYHGSKADKVRQAVDRYNAAMAQLSELDPQTYTHNHTIGDIQAVAFRAEYLGAFRRTATPPRNDLFPQRPIT
jgi:REP element-mobilizing transposase RayT